MARVTRPSSENRQKKVYHLTYREMKDLCSILDEDGWWKKLNNKSLRLSEADLRQIERNAITRRESPTEELIRRMGSRDYSVEELFACLYLVKNFEAMAIIKSHVNPIIHYLIHENEALKSNATNERYEEEKGGTSTDRTPSDGRTMLKYLTDYSYDTLKKATSNWTRKELGKGGFGVVLKIKLEGADYAVKVLQPPKKNQGESSEIKTQMLRQLIKELKYSNMCRHDNILPLYGYSMCENEKIYVLVYQFMSQGSLYGYLHEKNGKFDWKSRVDIVGGIACGLRFLHSTLNPPIVHGDIKSANILLDQNFFPKIGDFGLARQLREPYVRDNYYRGTSQYSPPEYRRPKSSEESFQGVFSTKVDVYALGLVQFEIITSTKPKQLDEIIISSGYESGKIWNNLQIHDSPMNDVDREYCESLMSIAEICIQKDWKTRPEMVQVSQKLMRNKHDRTSHFCHDSNTATSSEFTNFGTTASSEFTDSDTTASSEFMKPSASVSDDQKFSYYNTDSKVDGTN